MIYSLTMVERSVAKGVISEQELVSRMTPADLRNALDIINFLAQTGEISVDDAGTLMASAAPVMDRLEKDSQALREQQKEHRIGRRAFLKTIGNWGTAIIVTSMVGGGIYSCVDNTWGGAAQDKQRAIDKKLEDQDTLGITQSLSSYLGWTVRYASRVDGNFVPVGYFQILLIQEPKSSYQAISQIN